MDKVYIAARTDDSGGLLDKLAELGIIHISPVDSSRAVADEKTVSDADQVQVAIGLLSKLTPAGRPEEISVSQAAAEVLRIQRASAEFANRLAALHLEYEQLAVWGDVRLEEFEQLSRAGINVMFFSVPAETLGEVQAECVEVLADLPGKRLLVAVIDRDGNENLPAQAEPIELPKHDRPSLKAEAAEIDRISKKNNQRLCELANFVGSMEQELVKLQRQAEFSLAANSALTGQDLFAIQGWVPADKTGKLAAELEKAGIHAGVYATEPLPDEEPPTLISYPGWAKPIKGLFDILGTYPGYKELDMSPFFMVALPLFAAMLIGDAGYGLIFMLVPIFMYKKMVAGAGKAKTHLLMVIGASTLVWGVISANYFGITPDSFDATGAGAGVRKIMIALAPLWDADSNVARETLIKISLMLGCIHLTFAHLRQAVAFAPNVRALAEIGWCLFLWAMLGVIWVLFFGPDAGSPARLRLIYSGLIIGFILFVLFTKPDRNPAKMIGVGLASSLLPMLGTFSDTMSYIRLMAVGMASYYIAMAFNAIGGIVAGSATWVAGGPIVVFGHALNMALCVIAIFAHGVRLNMLEFSNNAGLQWLGYAYWPFGKKES